MLVGAFEVQIAPGLRSAVLRALRRARSQCVTPESNQTSSMSVIFSYVRGLVAEQLGRIERVPGVDAVLLDALARPAPSARRVRGCSSPVRLVRRRARSARPRCAGARCTSPGGRRSCRRCAPRPMPGEPVDVVARSRLQRSRARRPGLLHADEPLRRGAEDDRRLVAPAVRIAVRDLRVGEQHAALAQQRRRSRRSPSRCTGRRRSACRRQVHAVAADRIEFDAYCRPGRTAGRPRSLPTPWPGAVCTTPVPSSAVTWSPRMSGTRGRRTDAAAALPFAAPTARARAACATHRRRRRSAAAHALDAAPRASTSSTRVPSRCGPSTST